MSDIENTLYIEIEQKYKADHIDRKEFLVLLKGLKPYKQKRVSGPDTYFESDIGVLRWRIGDDKNELTVKKRYSKTNTFLRSEIDLNVGDNSLKTIIKFIKSMDYKKTFRIYKDCDIFWFKDQEGMVSIVLYKVLSKNHKSRMFIEIEADKGQPYKQSKTLIRSWEQKLGLKTGNRISNSLYEIYSGKITPMIEAETPE